MPLRDIVLTAFIVGMLPLCFKRPWVGVLMWVWVSVMSPHRLTWAFAYNFQFAMMIAVVTLVGMLVSKDEKRLPMNAVTAVLLLLTVQMSISTIYAINFDGSLQQWTKVMKIYLMLFVTMALLHTREHLKWLVLILTGSIAFYGLKGGLFTLRGGGVERVFGPPGSYIQENNALAVAVIMTIPLLRYYHLQVKEQWKKLALLGAMGLCGASALGSQSRGGLLAIVAMLGFLWLKGKNKLPTLIVLAMMLPLGYNFMPEKWHERMNTITTYQSDGSAMGRIDAWTGAVNLANERPLVGGGYAIYSWAVLAKYTPSGMARSAHSIWFQFLGEHGYPGLLLFILLWVLVWRNASWVVRQCRTREGWVWASDLARMMQVSLIGYFVGGAFLQLAYYDVPLNMIVAIMLLRRLVEKEVVDPAAGKGWYPRVRPAAAASGSRAPLDAAIPVTDRPTFGAGRTR